MVAYWKFGINRTLSLDPAHPNAVLLAREAGVPLERLARPLVTWWRTNLLADPAELEGIFNATGRFNLKHEAAIDWATWLQDRWTEMPAVRTYEAGVVEEPTVVMVEVTRALMAHGARVSADGRWYGEWILRNGQPASCADMVLLADVLRHDLADLDIQVDMQEAKLRNMQIPMSLFWRTVSPPHFDCAG